MDKEYQNLRENVTNNESKNLKTNYSLNKKVLMMYKNRLYVPNIPEIKLLILNEIHKSPCSEHPGYQKMITMLREEYFGLAWRMKLLNIYLGVYISSKLKLRIRTQQVFCNHCQFQIGNGKISILIL